ncbi:MAG: trehalase family glycosidase, partial [Candidatus Paceibacterota bacterium]
QWLWDSCFHAIILAQYDPEAAQAELRSLLSKQFVDGMVPHIIYWMPGILHLFRWGVEGTSSLTQPPMIAYAAWEIHRRKSDRPFLESIYPALLAYYRYLVEKRDPRDNSLVGIINPDESGEDNSPRFDVPLSASANISYKEHHTLREKLVDENTACKFDIEVCMREFFWVKDVPFNAVLVENLRALAHIASLLKHSDGEHFANLHADLITTAMRERLFHSGVYWSAYGTDYEQLKVATWAHFAPLFAGLYSADEAEVVVRTHLLNPETFYAPFGIRTVSKKEPSYRAEGYADGFSWRGPVWMSVHWFIYRGLMRYGYKTEAEDIRKKSVTLLQTSGFRECFNPETGEGLGAQGFTWGALVLDMHAE